METENNILTYSVENNKNLAFYNKCRICLDTEGFAVITELDNLPNNIYTFIGIKISESDDLPSKICRRCFEIIVDFIDLTSKANKNEVYLRTLFGTIKEENSVDSVNNVVQNENIISDNCSQNSKKVLKAVRKDLFESSLTSTVKEENLPEETTVGTHKEYDLKCNICPKIFKTQKQYMVHQRSHNKCLACPINVCGKKFATKGDLEKHIRSHTGERPYQCDECKKSFTQRVTLKAHKMSMHNMPT